MWMRYSVFEEKQSPSLVVYTSGVMKTIEGMIHQGRKGAIAMLEDLHVDYSTDRK